MTTAQFQSLAGQSQTLTTAQIQAMGTAQIRALSLSQIESLGPLSSLR